MKKINWKDVGIRALKTFIQTFLASLTVDGIFGITDAKGLTRFALTTGLSALAAAISAVWNVLLETLSNRAGEIVDKIGGEYESEFEEEGIDYNFYDYETDKQTEDECTDGACPIYLDPEDVNEVD